MKRSVYSLAILFLSLAAPAGASQQPAPAAPRPSNLSGTWNLDRGASQSSGDLGFGMDVVPRGGRADELGFEGNSGNPRSLTERPLSEQEARNARQMLDEVRSPARQLVISQTAAAVTVVDERGRTRTFHVDGRTDRQAFDAGPMASTSRWEADRFVVRYRVEKGREVHYTFSAAPDGNRLDVLTELVERGGRANAVRVYRRVAAGSPPPEDDTALPGLPSERVPAAPTASTPGQAPTNRPAMVPAVPSSAGGAPATPLDNRPSAELIGLRHVGLVIEGLGPEAAHCGIRQPAVESAVVQKLTEAGLQVAQNRDEDSYVYVHVMTTAMTTGFCFSRFDAYVYTNVAVTLPHGTRPVMVEVQLLHKGGLNGGGAGGHGEAVTRGIANLVAELANRIGQANK